VGEEKMSLYSSTTLSTCFCCMERPVMEAMDVVATYNTTRPRLIYNMIQHVSINKVGPGFF
jgi:hypothetical protein